MGGLEFLLIASGWLLPVAIAIFLVTSLVRITRSLGSIERELDNIRKLLERDRTGV